MKRRAPSRTRGSVPEHLAVFDIDRWGDERDVCGAFDRWKQARHDHADRHGWPGGTEALEAEEWDAVDVLPDELFDPDKV